MNQVDADDLSDMLQAAKRYEAEQKKQAAEARSRRGR